MTVQPVRLEQMIILPHVYSCFSLQNYSCKKTVCIISVLSLPTGKKPEAAAYNHKERTGWGRVYAHSQCSMMICLYLTYAGQETPLFSQNQGYTAEIKAKRQRLLPCTAEAACMRMPHAEGIGFRCPQPIATMPG